MKKTVILFALAFTMLLGIFSQTSFAAAPTGSVDVMQNTRVAGWAQDPDLPNMPIYIHIYINGEFRGAALADKYRGDVGWHAFNVYIRANLGERIDVYAIGVDKNWSADGQNPRIGYVVPQFRRADRMGAWIYVTNIDSTRMKFHQVYTWFDGSILLSGLSGSVGLRYNGGNYNWRSIYGGAYNFLPNIIVNKGYWTGATWKWRTSNYSTYKYTYLYVTYPL